MEKTYKVEQYFNKANHETRYRIVSTETGDVLDDAQGWGYKTIQNAYSGYSYKAKSKAKKMEQVIKERKTKKWMKENKNFVELMDACYFDIAKGSYGPDDKFDAKFVRKLLKDSELEVDFTPSELLRAWKKFG